MITNKEDEDERGCCRWGEDMAGYRLFYSSTKAKRLKQSTLRNRRRKFVWLDVVK